MRRALVLSLLSIGASGCTSFEGEPASDAGPGEAGIEAAANDAGIDAGGGKSELFDFEGTLGAGWQTTGDVKIVPGDCGTGTSCLEARFPSPPHSTSFAWRKLPNAPRIRILAKIKVTKIGDGEVDFFGIKRRIGGEGSWIVHHKGQFGYSLESAGIPTKDDQSIAATFAQWTSVLITFERDPVAKITWRVGDGSDVAIVLPPLFRADEIDLEVGGRYALDVTQSWAVRYDDIQIFDN